MDLNIYSAAQKLFWVECKLHTDILLFGMQQYINYCTYVYQFLHNILLEIFLFLT
jgi:hypothetical protein